MSEVTARGNVLLEEAAGEAQEEIASALRRFGLSGHAAEAFVALARLPEATAKDLIVKTGIPDSKIYYALGELEEAALVEVQEGKPKRYRVVPSREVESRLDRLLRTRFERERDGVRKVAALLEPLQSGARSPAMELAYVIKGRENVLARARKLLASASRDALLMVASEEDFRRLEDALVAAVRRGVRVRLALPDLEVDEVLARRAELRAIVCGCFVLVVDEAQILTVNGTADGDAYGITSTDETLVRLGAEFWESPRCCVAPC